MVTWLQSPTGRFMAFRCPMFFPVIHSSSIVVGGYTHNKNHYEALLFMSFPTLHIYIYTIYYIPLYSNDISMIPQVYPNKPHILSRQEPSSRSFQEIQEKRREEWRKLGIEAREFITGNYDGRWWVRGWCYPDTNQWEIQDPIDGGTLVLYFWPYFAGIFPEI